MQNDFAQSLLKYSAERDDSIGRPERWGNPPPLIVSSPLHEEMEGLAEEVWADQPRLVWYFLIGGPGNGKSEAVGAFVRRLDLKAEQSGRSPVFDATQGQHGGSIAYDFHGQLPQGEMWLLQDVSVPMSRGSDPADDLLASLDLCANPGAHILVCANRGMLLRATRLARKETAHAWLVPILEKIDKQSQETAIPNGAKWSTEGYGKQIEIRVWPLDHESILFGQGDDGNPWSEPSGSLFDQIVTRAVDPGNWEANGCGECPARELCPMLGDARWLRDIERRRATLKILRNAEVWSGQRIVLREALGLVSMVLVGCPSDFVEAGRELHPCEWVQRRATGTPAKPRDHQSLIELISHRIYQDLFGRSGPTGLALDRTQRRRDRWIIERFPLLGAVGESVSLALKRIDASFSKHAGPLRLIAADGILQSFDPAIDSAWCAKHSVSPDGPVSDLRQIGNDHQGELEQELGTLFQKLEDAARIADPHKDPAKTFAALYRWVSTLYLRLAGTALGETPNNESLTDYLMLLQQPSRAFQASGRPMVLRELMRASAGSGQQIELAPSFVADLPSCKLRPQAARARSLRPRWPANDRLTLQVSSGPTAGPIVLLTARTFIDTWRKQVLNVAEWNISPAMENLMRAWRDDFVVTEGQFRNLQAVEFTGKPPMEFEFVDAKEIQVQPKVSYAV